MVVKVERFEEIIAWQKAKVFSINVYSTFRVCKDYSFKNQIERASVSVMNNIAEGYERKTNNEFRQFLFIAKGSAAECRSMLDLALALNYITEENFDRLYHQAEEISKILSGFIKTL